MKQIRGFTLIELVVAVSLFAIVGAISYGALQNALSRQTELESQTEQWQQIQLGVARIEQDLFHAIARQLDDRSALLLDSGRLQFVRGGWPNPLGLPRAELRQIRYWSDEEGLWRGVWQSPDVLAESAPVQIDLLLPEISILRFRAFDGDDWRTSWPRERDDIWPAAIEVEFEIRDLGTIRRAVALADAW